MIESHYGRELTGSNYIGRVMPETNLDIWLSQGNEPCNLLKTPARLLKSSGEFRSGLVRLFNGNASQKNSQIFVKEYGFSRKIGVIKALIGWDRAPHVWKASWYLRNNAIPVPKPLGYFIYKKGKKWGKSYFCCNALAEGVSLAELAQERNIILNQSIFDDLFANIVSGIARLHQLGVLHGDLKWHNIHVDVNKKRYWFTDLDSCIIKRNLNKNKIIARDLGRFIISMVELGFPGDGVQNVLHYYSRCQHLAYEDLKKIIKPRIDTLTRRKMLDISKIQI